MEIRHNKNERIFYIEQEGKVIAEMTYYFREDYEIVINHTYVSPVLRGKGIARKLIEKGVEFAREKGYKIYPTCSYAKELLNREEQFADVVLKS
jgi:hypothetical protein